MKLYLVYVDQAYEVENHGIFSTRELAQKYIDEERPPGYKKHQFDIEIFYLNNIVEEQDREEQPKICGNTFTTKEKNLTYRCDHLEGHSGYHGDGRAIWGFEMPKMTDGGF